MKGRLLPCLTLLALPAIVPLAAHAEGNSARAAVPSPSPAVSRMFEPPQRASVPAAGPKDSTNPIDRFLLDKLRQRGLNLSARADKLRLLRRVTFDLTGLPPTLAEQEAFLADASADAYDKVVDRLLASPRFGERWAQHWLDLVRYAESDGFKADDLRPNAHLYRDYVIRAFNADLPYDRFVQQQLAGDEMEPANVEARIATGFLRLWPDEYNAANLEQRRQEILDDITDTTGLVFLGLTVGCARCHDHKYDPLLQREYYRLQAFFAPLLPRDDLPAFSAAARAEHQRRLAEWEKTTAEIRTEMQRLLDARRPNLRKGLLEKFRPEIQKAVLTPEEQRTPYQKLIAAMAEKQLRSPDEVVAKKLQGEAKTRYQELAKRLATVKTTRPEPLPTAMSVIDVGTEGPPTHRLLAGDWRKPREQVQAGFPEFLGDLPLNRQLPLLWHGLPTVPQKMRSSGLRSALARWLTRKDHPLTARVMVNRLWQHHFGVGLVPTSSDFGVQGEAVTHPELLDYLAVEFVEKGWSLKAMHRLMVTSAAYCQDSRVDPRSQAHRQALQVEPGNHLLWHARRTRLEGESLRDAMLLLSGDLNLRMFGPSARPKLPEGISKYAWVPDARAEDQNRRSVYVLARRNMRFPLFDAFDLPDMHNSCSRRLNTTTAPQALSLLNGEFTRERATRIATDILKRHGDNDAVLVAAAYRLSWSRPATADEVQLGVRFLSRQAQRLLESRTAPRVARSGDPVVARSPDRATTGGARAEAFADLCHALLNTNELLYVD